MTSFKKSEARDWAWENLKGVANVVIPTFTGDLKGLNEAGIRHDIRHEIKLGFAGTLLVSEVAITLEEYGRFCQWAGDEAKGRLKLIYHASFNTLEETIEGARLAERAGAELALLSYPANFYAETPQDIYDYTKAFCDATNLGVILFPVPLWGFDRVHASDIPAAVIRKLLDNCPNIVAIKAEGGMPSIQGFVECHRLFGKEVLITCPLEGDMIPLAQVVPIQFSGTSNTEYFGPMIPKIHAMLQRGEFDEATKLYWQIHPARKANAAASGYVAQTHFLHRMLWKYQGWLQGFNGGPLRQPTMRLAEGQMNALRQGLKASGLAPTEEHNREFFVGRNPQPTAAMAPARAAE
jgi:4-hydroxy-tetrahydrodipicolinate synthase